MKQGRFSNEQIVRILRETDQDSAAVVAKRHFERHLAGTRA